MAHYSQYRALMLSLDDRAATLESLPTHCRPPTTTTSSSSRRASNSPAAGKASTSCSAPPTSRHGHQCPDTDGRLTTEHDPEFKNCRCQDRAAGRLQDLHLLPF